MRLVALAAVLGGSLTIAVVAGWTDSFDEAINRLMIEWEVAWLVTFSEAVSDLGSVPIVVGVIAGIFGLLVWREGLRTGLWWLLMVLVTILVSEGLEDLVQRPRPVESLIHKTSWAYPSGHAMVSGVAIGIGTAAMVIARRSVATTWLWVGVAYAVAQSVARVYLRAHWLTDVIGGLLLGTAVVGAMLMIWGKRTTQVASESLESQ